MSGGDGGGPAGGRQGTHKDGVWSVGRSGGGEGLARGAGRTPVPRQPAAPELGEAKDSAGCTLSNGDVTSHPGKRGAEGACERPAMRGPEARRGKRTRRETRRPQTRGQEPSWRIRQSTGWRGGYCADEYREL